MAIGITNADLDEKTDIVDDDEVLVFDSEDLDPSTSNYMWKTAKMSSINQYQGNVAGRLYLHANVF